LANQEHVAILKQGVAVWNRWREENPSLVPDLKEADLSRANLGRAKLSGANLWEANLSDANLSDANLWQANLSKAILVETNLAGATLTQCSIYGISVWNTQLEGAKQDSLVITREDEPTITVDNLKVAQFIYLLLNNQELRDTINTLTMKVVLILGRFTPERKIVLDALRDELRRKNYLPIVFDFEKPAHRDLTETISTLAHMARFVIADITQAKSLPQELERIVPGLPSVPVQPLLQARAKEYGMFEHFKRYPWVLEIYRYTTVDKLLVTLKEHVIEPAEQKAHELEKR
jgi:Pentapeptide repeats (8 copies)